MVQQIYGTLELNLPHNSQPAYLERNRPTTASLWFVERFPDQAQQFGVPFIEVKETSCDGFSRVTPISVNIDFMAGMLGGNLNLDSSIVYFEPEMQFYYKEPLLQLYKPTSPEKLQNLYRAMLIRCAQELPGENNKLNLCTEFRNDKYSKAVVQRAKSILAASTEFFSPTSEHQRIKGPELYERVMRVLVETMLERSEGACLTVTQAYQVFCKLSEQRQLGQLKRSMFKATMQDLVKDRFDLCLRHDVPDSENKHQQAWKGLKLVEAEVLTA